MNDLSPLLIPDKKPDFIVPIEHIKNFNATYKENIKYEISVYKKGAYLILETEIKKDSDKIKYSNKYDLKTLKQNNKFLALCDNIEDIIDTIFENALNNTCIIIENEKGYEIKIPILDKSIKEISFIIRENKKEINEIINDLVTNSNLQKKKIEEQEKRIENQDIIIKELQLKVKYLVDENKKIKNELKETIKKEIINELKGKIEDKAIMKPIIGSKSNIINNDLFKKLNDQINPLKSLKFKLIFSATINGDEASDFHKFCDGKGPTVTIVKGENDHIFGGYVTAPFSSDRKSHYDDKAFLFSLTNKKKFPIKIKEKAVYHQKYWGPYIGYVEHCDLAISTKCLNNKISYCKPKSYEFNRVDLIGTTEENFKVKDYEVYLVNES